MSLRCRISRCQVARLKWPNVRPPMTRGRGSKNLSLTKTNMTNRPTLLSRVFLAYHSTLKRWTGEPFRAVPARTGSFRASIPLVKTPTRCCGVMQRHRMTKIIKQQATVRTNNIKGSVYRIEVEAVKFANLWVGYPSSDPCDAKNKDGKLLFGNQCAIRLSFAMEKAGVTFKSYPAKRKCWVHPEADHRLAAKELADWLELRPFVGCRQSESITLNSAVGIYCGRLMC